MDNLSGGAVVCTPPEDICAHFQLRPSDASTKMGIQLVMGCVLCKYFETTNGHPINVCLLLRNVGRDDLSGVNTTISNLLRNPTMIADEDFDIFVGDETDLAKFQLARLTEHKSSGNDFDDLMALLNKKFKTQKDENLHLAVLIDRPMTLVQESFRSFESRTDVPFGSVCLLGRDASDEVGLTAVHPIYPKLLEPESVRVGFPLSILY